MNTLQRWSRRLDPRRWIHLRRRWRIIARVEAADLLPDNLPPLGAVLVERFGTSSWIAFDCPCNQGHQIMLNLSTNRRPYWQVSPENRLTIRPSIDSVEDGVRCHFFIRGGRVKWVTDSTPRP